MFHRLDRPNPYLEKQVASEILFKQSMLDLDDIINHQPVSVSQNNIQLEKWKIWEMVGAARSYTMKYI